MQLTALHSLILEGIMTINNLYPQRQMASVLLKILRGGEVEQESCLQVKMKWQSATQGNIHSK